MEEIKDFIRKELHNSHTLQNVMTVIAEHFQSEIDSLENEVTTELISPEEKNRKQPLWDFLHSEKSVPPAAVNSIGNLPIFLQVWNTL